jgi:DNA polymerase (family 10)
MIGKLTNQQVADRLHRIGQLYMLKDERWRARSFLNAAKIVEDLAAHAMDIELLEIEGIGQGIEAVIHNLCASGSCKTLTDLENEFPNSAIDFYWMPGIGSMKAQELVKTWAVRTLEDLAEVVELAGETKTELYEKILAGLARKKQGRLPRWQVEPFASELILALQACEHVSRVEIAGSWRRERMTVKDLDVLVAIDEGWLELANKELIEVASRFGRIESAGSSKVRFRHVEACYHVDVDLLLTNIESWGAAICYFTGSKGHNERLRSIAKAIGLKVNEYGVFRAGICIGGAQEQDLYRILGLDYMEPRNRRT